MSKEPEELLSHSEITGQSVGINGTEAKGGTAKDVYIQRMFTHTNNYLNGNKTSNILTSKANFAYSVLCVPQ